MSIPIAHEPLLTICVFIAKIHDLWYIILDLIVGAN